jgi:hypothetical protein
VPLDNLNHHRDGRRPEHKVQCARHGCSTALGNGYVQLPEDRRQADPPHFCSTDCATQERFRRKYDQKRRWS